MINGVDYSQGWPGSAALTANGQTFVCRYLAEDSRGLTPDELADLTAGEIDVAVIYESLADRMLGGFAAGQSDAQYAQRLLVGLGLPARMPIYFTADFDATPEQQAEIDAYLAGCASVIGRERAGVYGGFYVVERCRANGTAAWFWQTSAWSGGQVSAHVHLYQYAYGYGINGVDCDRNHAYAENFGQARFFVDQPRPAPAPAPQYAAPDLPDWWERAAAQKAPSDAKVDGATWQVVRRNVQATADTYRYSKPDVHAPYSGPPVKAGSKILVERTFERDGKQWFVNDGGFYPASRYTPTIAIKARS
jgi:hypothetical protein